MPKVICLLLALCATPFAHGDCVVLLHGMARTAASMASLAGAIGEAGFRVSNVGYPSRSHPIEDLAPVAIHTGMAQCPETGRVHFVTHSLGGILVRYYLEHNPLPRLGRVVMLAPPNQGSEVVDNIRNVPGFMLLNGPAGRQLGTDDASIPLQLGPVDFELGVIAGSDTVNPLLSLYLPNPDDGKVSVASTRVEGMNDFIVLPYTHTFMMEASEVARQTILFLKTGAFEHPLPWR
jgi:pimeloyl-ACP methyl ester carboxylesterase